MWLIPSRHSDIFRQFCGTFGGFPVSLTRAAWLTCLSLHSAVCEPPLLGPLVRLAQDQSQLGHPTHTGMAMILAEILVASECLSLPRIPVIAEDAFMMPSDAFFTQLRSNSHLDEQQWPGATIATLFCNCLRDASCAWRIKPELICKTNTSFGSLSFFILDPMVVWKQPASCCSVFQCFFLHFNQVFVTFWL